MSGVKTIESIMSINRVAKNTENVINKTMEHNNFLIDDIFYAIMLEVTKLFARMGIKDDPMVIPLCCVNIFSWNWNLTVSVQNKIRFTNKSLGHRTLRSKSENIVLIIRVASKEGTLVKKDWISNEAIFLSSRFNSPSFSTKAKKVLNNVLTYRFTDGSENVTKSFSEIICGRIAHGKDRPN